MNGRRVVGICFDKCGAGIHQRLQGEEARYALALHSASRELNLTINEYCVADTVYILDGVAPNEGTLGVCAAIPHRTGQRRSHVVRFGRQHVHGGKLRFTHSQTNPFPN
jgi:hypothetical protein